MDDEYFSQNKSASLVISKSYAQRFVKLEFKPSSLTTRPEAFLQLQLFGRSNYSNCGGQ